LKKFKINGKIQYIYKENKLKREFLTQFLNKVSQFPTWVKEILYNQLREEFDNKERITYIFASYKPILTYKGRCEFEFKKSGFDTNIYNILEGADKDFSISQITLNTYFSMEEIAGYFLFCVDEGFLEIPDNSQILNIAGFLAGKVKTGEYLVNDGTISKTELDNAMNYQQSNSNKKLGQILIDLGLISQKQLQTLLTIKEEAKKRFVLDYNDVPKMTEDETNSQKQLDDLKNENNILKTKLEQLLSMVKKND
jgi:hypothetical protein